LESWKSWSQCGDAVGDIKTDNENLNSNEALFGLGNGSEASMPNKVLSALLILFFFAVLA